MQLERVLIILINLKISKEGKYLISTIYSQTYLENYSEEVLASHEEIGSGSLDKSGPKKSFTGLPKEILSEIKEEEE